MSKLYDIVLVDSTKDYGHEPFAPIVILGRYTAGNILKALVGQLVIAESDYVKIKYFDDTTLTVEYGGPNGESIEVSFDVYFVEAIDLRVATDEDIKKFTKQSVDSAYIKGWNDALDAAAGNADADLNVLKGSITLGSAREGVDYEIYVLANSILSLKKQ